MIRRKICLFTAHSPLLGGGGVILRSLIPQLTNLDITWYYIADKPAPGYENGYLGIGVMGGPILKDIWQTRKMLAGSTVPAVTEILNKLLQVNCDAYWIVSHNEGLRIALQLVESQQQRPVHMTIHDDWAGALCARSFRYRWMSGLANKLTIKALKAVKSFDVISTGMQQYYEKLSGRHGDVCHRYLPINNLLPDNQIVDNGAEVLAGHIGSIYDRGDFIAFLTLFAGFCESAGKKAVMQMWGCHLKMGDIPEELQGNIRLYPTLPEEEVLPQLSRCNFVYCMYPLSKALHTFASTSLPTKLTSYLQAGRPILGHGPANSTLAEFLTSTGLGTMWTSDNQQDGAGAMKQIIALKTTPAQWQAAREKYFGERNLEVINRVFEA